MRFLGTLLSALIVCFWIGMNALLVQRHVAVRGQHRYRAAVSEYLGSELRRERWLGVYRKGKKIGYTSYALEKVLGEEGFEFVHSVESFLALDLLGQKLGAKFHGHLTLDSDFRPKELKLDALIADRIPIEASGRAEGDDFVLTVSQSQTQLLSLRVPRAELFLGDGLVPSLPISGLRVGDTFSVPCFDPMTMSQAHAEVKVVGTDVIEVEGLLTDVFILETHYRDLESRSWVTTGGELVRQRFGPPLEDIVLRRESRAEARRVPER